MDRSLVFDGEKVWEDVAQGRTLSGFPWRGFLWVLPLAFLLGFGINTLNVPDDPAAPFWGSAVTVTFAVFFLVLVGYAVSALVGVVNWVATLAYRRPASLAGRVRIRRRIEDLTTVEQMATFVYLPVVTILYTVAVAYLIWFVPEAISARGSVPPWQTLAAILCGTVLVGAVAFCFQILRRIGSSTGRAGGDRRALLRRGRERSAAGTTLVTEWAEERGRIREANFGEPQPGRVTLMWAPRWYFPLLLATHLVGYGLGVLVAGDGGRFPALPVGDHIIFAIVLGVLGLPLGFSLSTVASLRQANVDAVRYRDLVETEALRGAEGADPDRLSAIDARLARIEALLERLTHER